MVETPLSARSRARRSAQVCRFEPEVLAIIEAQYLWECLGGLASGPTCRATKAERYESRTPSHSANWGEQIGLLVLQIVRPDAGGQH
jgi:hypothetical protein